MSFRSGFTGKNPPQTHQRVSIVGTIAHLIEEELELNAYFEIETCGETMLES